MASVDLENFDLDNPEFQDAWKLISYTRQSVFLTGKAGTGKSTFLRYIVENTKKRCVVLAPTGIAAVNARGVTLHSFFHIPFKPLLPDDPEFAVRHLRQRLKHSPQQQKLIRQLELIIIDEVSMVRADIIDFVDKICRVYSGRLREPFGGKQLLLVGDLYQLEPVVTADMRDIFRDLYPNPYFFSARAFADFPLVAIELRKVYRQNDEGFIALLDNLRLGAPTREDISLLNGRIVDNTDDASASKEMVMTLAPKRDTVEAINANHLEAIKRKLYTFEGEIKDKFPESSLPAPMELQLKVGAQVVFVRNDPEKRWVNGSLGRVYSIDKENVTVDLDDGSRHAVQREVWENIEYKYNEKTKGVDENVLGTFTQFPLRLAWALTIHKSQGLTFSNVIIDLNGGAFAAGQAYVALSRCRSLDGLHLKCKVNPYNFYVNPAVLEFGNRYNNQAIFSKALSMARADDTYNKCAKAFDEGNFSEALDLFINAIYLRDELRNPAVRRVIKQKLYHLASAQKEVELLKEQKKETDRKLATLAREYFAMGDDCFLENNYIAAIGNYKKGLDIYPSDDFISKRSHGALLIASAEVNGVDADELYYQSLDSLMAACQLDGEDPMTHDLLAKAYSAMGQTEDAKNHKNVAKKLRKKQNKK